MSKQDTRHIVIIAPPNSTLLNTAGPLEIFSRALSQSSLIANRIDFEYQTHVISVEKETTVVTSSGLAIIAESCYTDITYSIDTLLVAGLPNGGNYQFTPALIQWLQEQYKVVRRIGSVCSGAFLLAQAGILNDRRATVHWSRCDALQEEYPRIKVEVSRIYVKDGKVYTSAGITAGMDLALALVEEDYGQPLALHIARFLVLALRREGNQMQYSTFLDCQSIEHPLLRKACQWVLTHLKDDLTVEKLAEEVAMSPRNFARVFVRELNTTPAKYITRVRVNYASQYLIETEMSFDEIAVECGLKNAENLRRSFLDIFEMTPMQYRKRFKSSICC